MNYKRIIAAPLLVFVVVSTVYLAVAKHNPPKDTSNQAAPVCRAGQACNPDQPAAEAPVGTTIAYYFHRTARCWTCRALESNAREAIQRDLAHELAKGRVTIQAVNVEEPGNRHYIERYQLVGPSLVLSYRQDGKEVRWKNLDKIWALIRNPAEYQAYVAAEVRSFMDGKS